MRFPKCVGLALVLFFLASLSAFADSQVSIGDTGGNWQSTGSGIGSTVLGFTGSQLTNVSGLMAPYNCPMGSVLCSGTVTLFTGTLASGHLNPTNPCPAGGCTPAIFNGGGNFMVTNTTSGGGFTFSGSFSSASWTKYGAGTLASPNYWTFVGTITNATLTLGNGQTFFIGNAGTINLSTISNKQPVSGGGGFQWQNAGGATTFASPVPEPSSLALLGSGLVSLGIFVKRKFRN